MQNIGGKKYYGIDEAAKLAGVSVRTLRRWLSADRLSDFLFPFRISTGELLYRLEPPEGEEKNGKGEYIVNRPDGPEGGGMDESSSS